MQSGRRIWTGLTLVALCGGCVTTELGGSLRDRVEITVEGDNRVPVPQLGAETPGGAELPTLSTRRLAGTHTVVNADDTISRFYFVEAAMIAHLEGALKGAFPQAFDGPNLVKLPSSMPNNQILMLRGPEGLIGEAENFIDQVFARVPQIEIQARILEISSEDGFSIGASTNLIENPSDEKTLFDRNLNNYPTEQFVASQNQNTPFIGSQIFFKAIHDELEVETIMQALQTRSDTEVLSNPRIAVLNGTEAKITAVDRVPVQTVKNFQQNGNFAVSVDFEEAGITLSVTPKIVGTDTIHLKIQASVSNITGFTDPGPNGISNPIINKREANTDMHIRDGQTTIIGGLITKTQAENETKVPILGDIPILGYLFRRRSSSLRNTELVYIITPRIIVDSDPTGTSSGAELIIPEDL
ncbi:MAG: type II and III secretion system protein [Planctomycetota bacterium]